jgi:hypothetical protein
MPLPAQPRRGSAARIPVYARRALVSRDPLPRPARVAVRYRDVRLLTRCIGLMHRR